MENDILDSLNDLGYQGPLSEEAAFAKALDGGPKSLEYTKLVHILAEELKTLCHLEETVNMMNNPDESSVFLLELSSFLKELGCPYKKLVIGHMSSRLQTREDRLLLLDYLISELMAARMVNVDQPKEKQASGMEIVVQESPTAKDLKEILILLKFNKPPPNITPEMLFSKLEAKIKETIQKEGEQVVGKPLYNKGLTEKDWKQLDVTFTEMYEEYRLRRETLIARLECTIQSFEWSERLKNKKDIIQSTYRPKREHLKVKPNVKLSDFLAARSSLLQVEKTSSANVRKNTQSDVNKVIIGRVPDRGGRPNEQQPPPPEMPSWQQRAGGQGGGAGGRGGGAGGRGGGAGGRGSGVGAYGGGGGGRVQGAFNQGAGDQGRPQTSPASYSQNHRNYQTYEVPPGGYSQDQGGFNQRGGYNQTQNSKGYNQTGYTQVSTQQLPAATVEVKEASKTPTVGSKQAGSGATMGVKQGDGKSTVQNKQAGRAVTVEEKEVSKATTAETKQSNKAATVEVKQAGKAITIEVNQAAKAPTVGGKQAGSGATVVDKQGNSKATVQAKQAGIVVALEGKVVSKATTVVTEQADKIATVEVKQSGKAVTIEVNQAGKAPIVGGKQAGSGATVEAKQVGKAATVEIKQGGKVATVDVGKAATLGDKQVGHTATVEAKQAGNAAIGVMKQGGKVVTVNVKEVGKTATLGAKQVGHTATVEIKQVGNAGTVELKQDSKIATVQVKEVGKAATVGAKQASNTAKVEINQPGRVATPDIKHAGITTTLGTKQAGHIVTVDSKQAGKAATVEINQPGKVATPDIKHAGIATTVGTKQAGHIVTVDSKQAGKAATAEINQRGKVATPDIKQIGKATTVDVKQVGKAATPQINRAGRADTKEVMQIGKVSTVNIKQGDHDFTQDVKVDDFLNSTPIISELTSVLHTVKKRKKKSSGLAKRRRLAVMQSVLQQQAAAENTAQTATPLKRPYENSGGAMEQASDSKRIRLESFQKAPLSIRLSIVPHDYPNTVLNAEQEARIKEQIWNSLFGFCGSSETGPICLWGRLIAGAAQVSCEGSESANWLRSFDGNIVGGVKIKILDAMEPVKMAWKRKRVSAAVPISQELTLLRWFNPGIFTPCWKILNTTTDGVNASSVVLMDQASAHSIMMAGYVLHGGLDPCYFKILESDE